MGKTKISWDKNNYSLLRRILTKILENPDIHLCIWRRPNETQLPLMTKTKAIIRLVEIALPGYIQCDQFIPETYAHAVSTKIGRLYKIYFIHLYPEIRDQLIASNDYRITREKNFWALLEQLGGESPGRHGAGVVDVKPPRRPEGRLSGKNKVKAVVDLTGVDGDGNGGSLSIKTEASDYSTPAKPSATLEPGAGVLVTPNTVPPSIEATSSVVNEATPMSVTPRTEENKKRPALDSVEDLDALQERKLQKAREHELAVLNAKIRLVEAETKLAKIRGDYQKK